jgi:transposase
VKLIERDEARRLRREEGLAIRVIAEQLGVSKSSVSVWKRDVELTEEQHEQPRQANPIHNQQHRGQEGRRATARWARLAAQEHGRATGSRSRRSRRGGSSDLVCRQAVCARRP